MYNNDDQLFLLSLAREVIYKKCSNEDLPEMNIGRLSKNLREKKATFVTLKNKERLRGCMGNLFPHQELVFDVMYNALSAAFHDARFSPVRLDELGGLTIEISVLSLPTEVSFCSELDLVQSLVVGEDGILLKDKNFQATFLPSVWSQIHDKEMFLRELKVKAGLPPQYWSDTICIWKYHVDKFSE